MNKKILIFLMFVASILFATVYPFDDAGTLIHGWHFDEGTGTNCDDVKVDNDGTISLTGGWTSSTPFTAGNAVSLLRSTVIDFGNLTNAPAVRGAWSIGWWNYSISNAGSYNHFNTNNGAGAMTVGGQGNDYWSLSTGTGLIYFTTVAINTSAWSHVIFTFDGTRTFTLYEDGGTVHTAEGWQAATDIVWTNFYFGYGAGSDYGMYGYVDDLKINTDWTSPSEALDWYNGSAPVGAKKKIPRPNFGAVIE